jgi:putative colanic acid biosynthesis UDP-glucose lipid carrier transferase
VQDLPKLAVSQEIDLVVIALPWDRTAELDEVAQLCAYVGADVIMPCRLGFEMPERAKLMELGSLPSLVIASRPLKGTKALVKLAEDYLFAAMLLVLLSPVMLFAALAIRLSSPGPVLYRQTRTGLNHAPFTIFKFRTMRFDLDDDPTRGTQANDPRVTWVGNLLRRTSLDELPQLLNVLRGEMSLVGPRPYAIGMLVDNEEIADTARYFAARYKIKPGLTGLAQVHGLRSNGLRSRENARLSVELDLQYVESWSLWLDLRIMLRTALFGMAGKHIF